MCKENHKDLLYPSTQGKAKGNLLLAGMPRFPQLLLYFSKWQTHSDRSFRTFQPSQSTRRIRKVAWGLILIKYKCWAEKGDEMLFSRKEGSDAEPWEWGIIIWNKERGDSTFNVDVFLRVCWSRPSQAVGSERQHHRVPAEECGPRYRVCPDPLCALWVCGRPGYLRYLQNLWVPAFSCSSTHLKYCAFIFLFFSWRLISFIPKLSCKSKKSKYMINQWCCSVPHCCSVQNLLTHDSNKAFSC